MLNVSVVVPCYNSARFLTETIQSILSQSVLPEKLVIVDDGSTDETQSIVAPFLEGDVVEIVYVRQNNQGVSAARNHGASLCESDFIAFLDSDDRWEPDFLKAGYQLLEENSADAVVFKNRTFHTTPGDIGEIEGPDESFIAGFPEILIQRNTIGPSMVLMRKSAFDQVGGFASSTIYMEDWELWLSMAAQGAKFCFSEQVLLNYRKVLGSRSNACARFDIECANTVRKHRHTFPKFEWMARQHESRLRLRAGRYLLMETLVNSTGGEFAQALASNPRSLRALGWYLLERVNLALWTQQLLIKLGWSRL